MAEVWYLPNGKMTYLFSEKDYLTLIRKSLGADAEKWVKGLMENDAYEKARAETDCNSYEESLDDLHQQCQDWMEELDRLLRTESLSRAKILSAISDIRNKINSTL